MPQPEWRAPQELEQLQCAKEEELRAEQAFRAAQARREKLELRVAQTRRAAIAMRAQCMLSIATGRSVLRPEYRAARNVATEQSQRTPDEAAQIPVTTNTYRLSSTDSMDEEGPFADCVSTRLHSSYLISNFLFLQFWPEVTASSTHAVLYELPLPHDGRPPKPHSNGHGCKWDQQHVRMPYDPQSLHPSRKVILILPSFLTLSKSELTSPPLPVPRGLHQSLESHQNRPTRTADQ